MSEVWKEKETEFLQMYVDDLKALAPEKEGEKASLFEKCIAGDNEAVKRLVELYLMKSVQIASKYTGQGLSLADLIQEANVALMLALTEIDSADKANDEYIAQYVEQYIKQAIDTERSEKSSEEELADRINLLSDVTKELAERFGREATLEEIHEYTKFTEDEIKTLMKISLDAL
ncbi:MAG: RNA polymerase subunit sigma-70 [Lachnospiraceae bacterium]|nr:RNA polymerase subunit sigma-70 [Lachnospiraceae bacterium]